MRVSNQTRRGGALSQQAGFTLVELMIAVAIIGVAMAIAMPNFTRMYIDYQARVTASEITRHLVFVRTRAMTTNQTLNVQIVLVNGGVQMTTTDLAGAPALQGRNRIEAVQMTTLAFNNGGLLPNGGVVQFNSYGLRTSVPGTGVQTITVGGTLGGAPTTQYLINIAPSGTSGLVRL
ncbi:MAG TPA: prepilin-type N-terminal cleavage/methylation domain-containing protein [Nitrospiraceae bacterium]|nr:prepilin-type N-terminal cleavage/methylation domain-containing protein [Nitrospiraceae bacterium]